MSAAIRSSMRINPLLLSLPSSPTMAPVLAPPALLDLAQHLWLGVPLPGAPSSMPLSGSPTVAPPADSVALAQLRQALDAARLGAPAPARPASVAAVPRYRMEAPRSANLADPSPLADHKNAPKAFATGKLFVDGVRASDVQQGAIGDCYLAAGLAATAHANPRAIQDAVKQNRDGTYTVRFFDKSGKAQHVNVDGELYRDKDGQPLYAKSTNGQETWPAIIEKAYAKWKGGYDKIGNGGHAKDVVQALTGKPSSDINLAKANPAELYSKLDQALRGHKPITASTYSRGGTGTKYENSGVVANHAYTVTGVQTVNGEKYVELRNPWAGTEYKNGSYITDVDRNRDGALDGNDGFFRMKLADFQRLYQTVSISK